MFSQRAILMELSILIASCFLAASSHAATLRLSTSEREFRVTTFQSPGSAPRAAVVVLSGAKGYGAGAYSRLTSSLNAAGIDVFLVHFISDADVVAMESAGSARARIAYYGRRMREWRETVRVTIDAIGRQPIYDRSKIGALGISLGAMPVMAETANSSTIHATAAVDGGFPANFQTRVHSMPPFLAIWGSNDQVFSLSTGTSIHHMARSLGGPSEIMVYRGEGHAFFLEDNNVNAGRARDSIVQFFSKFLRMTR